MSQTDHTWAMILAAGDGTRLRDLTGDARGSVVPKQYCTLHGGPTLLADTLRRAQSFATLDHISVVVAEQHRALWQRELSALPADNIVVQPRNCGSGNGVLLQLLQVCRRDPQALVVLLPSDHFVAGEAVLAQALQTALAAVRAAPQQIVMLGMRPARADVQLGYIIPGAVAADGPAPVAGFVEKPAVPLARRLIARGALWNAFILVFSAPTLLRIYAQRMPGVLDAMRAALADPLDPAGQLAALYARLPSLDFSRDLLAESATLPLRVLPVAECGWNDLGTPECVARVLARMPEALSAAAWSRAGDRPVNLAAKFHGAVRSRRPAPRAVVHC